ncbi:MULTISPECIES: hypothetical protein [Pseudomonas]|uniref:hypothetical protein n=1 Tax=Pseudomonas TaxID=286 RepID=UPI001A911796|nr:MULTISPECIES: hypothetical protein [Pseudomonas]
MQRQLKILIGLWEFITLTAFPIHLLDDENRKLVNPIVDTSGGNPSSEGYAGGSRPDSLTTTGGRPIGGVGETDYVRPVEELPSSGVVYNFQGEKITQGVHAKIRNKEGRPVGSVVNNVQVARPADILIQDDGRWVIKGLKDRVHIIEPDGEVVTSLNNPKANTRDRILRGQRRPASQDELDKFESIFSNYVRW